MKNMIVLNLVRRNDVYCGGKSVFYPLQWISVTGKFVRNTSSKVIGVIPVLRTDVWKIEIHTQYTSAASS
ncbi:MAG: hypothetical protein LBB48_03665 [Treponema sp.]|nr:hypothetical protein [Treponema sp.]